ncbi:MAG: hypothetical protein IPJ08_00625 [Burkholderiales bacterium]|nr:hypothetical protein [Burkholderiales bacterium]
MNKNIRKLLGGVAVAMLVSACGGGGGGAPVAAATANPLAGVWGGTSTSGEIVIALILEDGQLLSANVAPASNSVVVNSLAFGTLQTSGNSVSSSDMRVYTPTGTAAATLAGTYKIGSSVSAAISQTGATATILLAPVSVASYDYNIPATQTAATGAWTGSFNNGTGSVVVNSNGTFSATTGLGCNMSGLLRPRDGGKNVYDVTVNFDSVQCGVSVGSATGNAVIDVPSAGTRELVILFRTTDGAGAGIFTVYQ